MIHLRLVVPHDLTQQVMDLLCASEAVSSVVRLEGAAKKPDGDLILADVAREDASVIISDLKEMDLDHLGTIALEEVDSAISDAAEAAEKAAKGSPADAVVWEHVESRTSEETELSVSFVLFMIIAMLIAGVGVVTDSPILIIGAMVVGPEFGPLAGFCVAIVQRRGEMAKGRSSPWPSGSRSASGSRTWPRRSAAPSASAPTPLPTRASRSPTSSRTPTRSA